MHDTLYFLNLLKIKVIHNTAILFCDCLKMQCLVKLEIFCLLSSLIFTVISLITPVIDVN